MGDGNTAVLNNVNNDDMTYTVASGEIWQDTGIRRSVVTEIRQLAEQCMIRKVVLFGSRARGDFHRSSDIDLAVSGGDAERFRLELEENTSTLLQYDVVNLDRHIQQGLRERIEEEGVTVYEKI